MPSLKSLVVFQSRNRETFDSNTFTYTATDAEGITVSIS